MDWLFGILACLVAHLPGPCWRGEELAFPTGQETLTALGNGEGGGEGVGGEEKEWGKWEGMGRRGGSGNFYKQTNKLIKKYVRVSQ